MRTIALGVPNDRERPQWYFRRYVEQPPAGGESVLFDRSWYNRAGVERGMRFATEDQVEEFLRAAPDFERMLISSGLHLIKYRFSGNDEEQERRFRARTEDPTKRFKLSPMDLASWSKRPEYSRAKDEMFAATGTPRVALVGRRRRGEAPRAAQLHRPPARPGSPTRT